MLWIATLAVLASSVLVRGLWLQRRLSNLERVWHESRFGVTLELRRKTVWTPPRGNPKGEPRLRECRAQVLRVLGVPAISRTMAVALPERVESRWASVSKDEFDHLFKDGFRWRAWAD